MGAPYAFYLVCGNRHAYARAAKKYAFIRYARHNGVCDKQGVIGIVTRVALVGAEIGKLVPAVGYRFNYSFPKRYSAVIRTQEQFSSILPPLYVI